MRLFAAFLLATLVSRSLPVHAQPVAATESLSDRAAPRRTPALVLPAPAVAPAATSERRLELVPSVHRGHSAMWKSGAIITFASLGVSLIGAGMTVAGLGSNPFQSNNNSNESLFFAGIVISAIGDGGLVLGGPGVWIAGIGRPPE